MGKTLSINKHLDRFSKDDINAFQETLYQELTCENDTKFLQKVLALITKLSHESIDRLYNKAHQLSCKYPIKKENDLLSNMSSNVIEHLGKF